MTTTADLIEETLGDLRSGGREIYNELQSAVTTSDTMLSFAQDIATIQQGAVVAVGLEEMFVWSTDPTAKTAVVKRGWNGTSPAAYDGGELVTVNPRFSGARCLRAINRELSALSGELYQVKTEPLVASAVAQTYPLPAGLLDVYQVYLDTSGPENFWQSIPSWQVRRSQNLTDFPSGNALRFNTYLDAGRNMQVVYKAEFVSLATLADDVVAVSGLPASAVDIIPVGAQMRLMGVREAKRAYTEAQSDTRRAQEVASGSATRSYSVLSQIRRERIAEERTKLLRQYPVRRPN